MFFGRTDIEVEAPILRPPDVKSQLIGKGPDAGKSTALTIQTFAGKFMSLLSNMLSRFVIAFLPTSEHLLI